MTKRYKNKVHRMLNDYNWDGMEDDYQYSGPNKLRRNKIDGVIGGVCAGIADYVGIDVVIIRVIVVLLVLFTGFPIIIYPILWFLVPADNRAPYVREYREAKKARKEAKATQTAPVRTASFRDVKSKFRSLETRLQDLERSITSSEWQLRRQFRDLEN